MSVDTLERELVAIEPSDALAVFTAPDFAKINPILARVRKEIDAFELPDVSTEKGRAKIKAMARKVVKSRTYLQSVGKALADDAKALPKKIDATRSHITKTLEQWEADLLQPVTDWETAEVARQAKHKVTLASLEEMQLRAPAMSADAIRSALKCASGINPNDGEEYASEIEAAKAETVAALHAALTAREKLDADQAELARLRAKDAERERLDREADIAAEAAERARKAAEQKAADEIAAANKAREDAEQRATEAAQKAVEEQKVKEAKAAEEAAARERNRKHCAAINNAAADALIAAGIDKDIAKQVVILIAKKAVPAVSISY